MEVLDLCDERRDLKKKRYEAEGAKEYREANRRVQKAVKKAKEDWIGAQCEEQGFKYLGAVVSDDGSKPEVLSRIAQATAALTKLKPIWRDNNISLGSKVKMTSHFLGLWYTSGILVTYAPVSNSRRGHCYLQPQNPV